MIDVYVSNGELYCEDCALISDDGPHADGGGEADVPQHCGDCGAFLCNPLTREGYDYLAQEVAPYIAPDDGSEPDWRMVADRAAEDGRLALVEWIEFYHDGC